MNETPNVFPDITETAKATQEVAKATGKVVDAARELGGFVAKYIAGPLEQGVGIVEDKLRYLRWERQVRLMRRADELLASVGLNAPTRAVPMKLAIPILQGASIEEDDGLQDRWAALLVNVANVGSGIDVQRSFLAILEQLSSLEVHILDVIYSLPFDAMQHDGVWSADLPNSARVQTEDDQKALEKGAITEPPDDVKIGLGNLARLGCLRLPITWGGGESFVHVNPTILGAAFVRACRVVPV
jgi:hypothetical protein